MANSSAGVKLKGIVHFEIHFLYVSAYLKGVDVGVRCRFLCFHSVFNFDIFLSNRCCLSVIHWGFRGSTLGSPQRACTEKSKLKMIE